MFNRGINDLLAALPAIADLTVDQIRRILTTAWLETTGPRLGADQRAAASAETLRRLATALELHAILPLQAEQLVVRACAFVAAEALTIAQDLADADETVEQPRASTGSRFWLFGPERSFERLEAALLYLIAGYDANAALTTSGIGAEDVGDDSPEGPIASWAVQRIVGLCRLAPAAEVAAPALDQQAHPTRILVRHELWRRIGVHVSDHLDWLMIRTGADPNAGAALRALAERLENRDQVPARPAAHPDLHHLLLLLAAACDETGSRALRAVPPPPQDTGGLFAAYQRDRATSRPLLWPAAQEYADATLPGPEAHAVVAVPTNSGKSSVAELAISQALCRGWVLYLAPTNALVGQIRRQVADVFGRATVREFLGGAEYTQLIGESLEQIEDRQVLVMTPEKCSLALRQNPEAFEKLALCVFDEAHLLGDRAGRGVIAELVVAEIMHRARQARLLLMSALIANPSDLGAWLSQATATPTAVINEPWRPTRTLRAIAGIDRDRGNAAANAAYQQLRALPPHRKRQKFNTPIALLAGLQGAWASQAVNDYALVQTDIEVPAAVTRKARWDPAGYCTPATAAIVQRLGLRGDKILAFLPRSKHDSFHAASMTQFAAVPADSTVDALLHLAEFELGVSSALRAHLRHGVAVHTSALLREEQRASEISFERGIAVAMYATGTMAQGLNLPATAVVIGGTEIGYDNTSTVQQRRDQARAQLLNAIGRAGRAHIAPRSMAIVVPNRAIVLSSSADAQRAVRNAEFLQDEDASSELSSALGRADPRRTLRRTDARGHDRRRTHRIQLPGLRGRRRGRHRAGDEQDLGRPPGRRATPGSGDHERDHGHGQHLHPRRRRTRLGGVRRPPIRHRAPRDRHALPIPTGAPGGHWRTGHGYVLGRPHAGSPRTAASGAAAAHPAVHSLRRREQAVKHLRHWRRADGRLVCLPGGAAFMDERRAGHCGSPPHPLQKRRR